MNNRTDKDYDCMDNKRKAQEDVFQQTKDMSPQEEIEYFQNSVRDSALGNWWKSMKHKADDKRTTAS